MVTWWYLDRDAIVDIREVTQSRKDLKWVIGRDPYDDSAVHFNDYGRLLKALAVWEAIPICGQASHGGQPSGPLRKQVTSRLIMLGVDVGPELMLTTLIIFIIKNVNLEHQYSFVFCKLSPWQEKGCLLQMTHIVPPQSTIKYLCQE